MSEVNTTPAPGTVSVSHAEPAPPPVASKPQAAPKPPDAPNKFAALGFPKTKYHPVQGKKIFDDPNAAAVLDHNWFDTPEAADAARTEREAVQVVHHNLNHKVQGKKDAGLGIVRNSVSAQESVDAGNAEPM